MMINPFSDPAESKNSSTASEAPNVKSHEANPLFIPGVVLLLDSLFWLLFIVVGMAFVWSPGGPMREEELAYVRIGSAVSYGLMFMLALVVAAGAVAMMTLKRKWLAWTGCIVGLLPIFGPCFGLTIPIALWTLLLLRRPEVSARFT